MKIPLNKVYFQKSIIEIILYGVFGLIAFFINVFSFYILFSCFNFYYLLSNLLSWIIATSFAFFSNKFIVFRSRDKFAYEAICFFIARILTLVVDMLLMWFFVGILSINELVSKNIVNIIIIIINYILSKYWIFISVKNANSK